MIYNKLYMLKNNESIIIDIKGKRYYCPVEVAMDVIGGKWKAVILWYLIAGTLRYNQLKKQIVSISERILIRELKELEQSGLIKRKAYPTVPPKVEYSLSPYGKSIIPLVQMIASWGEKYTADHGKYLKAG